MIWDNDVSGLRFEGRASIWVYHAYIYIVVKRVVKKATSTSFFLRDTPLCICTFQNNDVYLCFFRASKMSDFLMVAAIDFGATYSGYAFSMISDPLQIHTKQAWNSGGRLVSSKTPTCLLLDGRQQFVSFGYAAENYYTNLVEDDKHHDHYFFHRFQKRSTWNYILCLKILKRLSWSVNGRTDYAMAKGKRGKQRSTKLYTEN